METHDFYKRADGGEMNAARALLALNSEQGVRAIVALIQWRGVGVIDDIFRNEQSIDPVHVLGYLYNSHIKPQYVPALTMSFSVIAYGQYKNLRFGNDEYTRIIMSAFPVPESYARLYANKVETEDVIKAAEGSGLTGQVNAFLDKMGDYFRNPANSMLNALGLGTLINWDQTQKYDLDGMYELAVLGNVLGDFKIQSEMMSVQRLTQEEFNGGRIAMGDPESGDISSETAGVIKGVLALAALHTLSKPIAPNSMLGGFTNIVKAGTSAMAANLQKYSKEITGEATAGLAAVASTANPAVRQLADKAKSSTLLKLATKPYRMAYKAGKKIKDLFTKGDIDSHFERQYDRIGYAYGDAAADAWAMGDIESIVGDPDGDPNDPETGGLFSPGTRRAARLNMQKQKRQMRINARNKRKAKKFLDRKGLSEKDVSELNVDPNEFDAFAAPGDQTGGGLNTDGGDAGGGGDEGFNGGSSADSELAMF